jgi:hypothetical protein
MVLQRYDPGVTRSKQYTPMSLLHDIYYLNHGATKILSCNKLMGLYSLDLVTPGTYLCNTMIYI